MAQPLQERRSARDRAPRRSLADEQAWEHHRQQEALEVARAIRQVAETVEPSDSSEEDMADDEGSSSEDDQKTRRGQENIRPWVRELHDPTPTVYTDTPIVQLPRHHQKTELGFVQCYLDPALMDMFVKNTNLYATARQARDWTPTNTAEMWRYLAVRIRQGIVVLPRLHYYWSAEYRDVYITRLMTRDRFEQLHRYFHIEPPVPRDQRQTVLEKTNHFYHQCQRLFEAYYVPGRDFALDETMIRFQGRSAWITVIKDKPTPVGYKLYTVASDGYLLGFRVYCGRGGYDRPQSVLHHTVVELVKPWGGVNRRLYFDNLYTSPALCDHLLREKIRSCGTCRPNRRGLPPDLKQTRSPAWPRTRRARGSVTSWAVSSGMMPSRSSS